MKNKDPFVTKGMLDGVVDVILKGMDNMYYRIDKRFEGVDKKFDKVEARLGKIEENVTFIKRDVSDIKAKLSDTPSRREFNSLKGRVDKFVPASQ